jgi:hypothetical protein
MENNFINTDDKNGVVQSPVEIRPGTGWGIPQMDSKNAWGEKPIVNPFLIPRAAGLNRISQVFPNNYYRNWDLTQWRQACDSAIKFGYGIDYAVMTSWAFEISEFVQFLFRKVESAIGKVPFLIVNENEKENEIWTAELCGKLWHKTLRQEIALSHFWGYTVLNFDPVSQKIYKYPMQNIDPVNHLLKWQTYSIYDGIEIEGKDDLLFIQPSNNYERFLGWMQPISRSIIMINNAYNNWFAAGKRMAYPLMQVGYAEDQFSQDSNGNQLNQGRDEADTIAKNIDPSKAIVTPFTFDNTGKPQYKIDITSKDMGNTGKQHEVYSALIEKKQNEIMQMIMLGTLSSGSQKNGNRALGEVHERGWEDVALDMIEYVETYLNSVFIKKIAKWYVNFPSGIKFKANVTKNMKMDEIKVLSSIMKDNGKKLTDEFFVANGIPANYFEDFQQISPNPTK